jgi:hypothetical protein
VLVTAGQVKMPQKLKQLIKMWENPPLVTALLIITSTANYNTSVVVKLTFIILGDHVLVSKMNW